MDQNIWAYCYTHLIYLVGLCGIGASHYGIGDIEALAKETHKFESRYLDGLLLPLDDPNCKALMEERSPIHHTDKLNCPIALFQGDQDKVSAGRVVMRCE